MLADNQSGLERHHSAAEVCSSLGIVGRTLDRWLRAGTFPQPDLVAGTRRLWRASTIRAWLASRQQEGTTHAQA